VSAARGGTVFVVGAGPGDPGLITVRGRELLRRADVVLHDRLVAPELLAEVRQDAELVDVGKTPRGQGARQAGIHRLLVNHARSGKTVVRLKGGDPFVFGRGAEEVLACRAAGIHCEVVPGVSSATAVPAAAGIPLTRRGVARSFAVVTGQVREGEDDRWLTQAAAAALAAIDTVVVLMSHRKLREICRALEAAGRDPATPVACVQNGTRPDQAVTRGTLRDIADRVIRDGLSAPLVTVVGAVAGED
jgi:uroporphyrin-III C-methyltransferase